jgi:hypothetical protein
MGSAGRGDLKPFLLDVLGAAKRLQLVAELKNLVVVDSCLQ